MLKYFFDVRDAKGTHRDNVGDDFVDFEEARDHAQAIISDIVREELPDGERCEVVCEIRNQSGGIVYRGEITYQGTRF